jgi:hypothetical protein
MSKKWELSRRTVLRGAGTLLGLPMLEAMLPSVARAQEAGNKPVRLVTFFVPTGMIMPNWTPAAEGASYALSRILASLEPVKQKVLVLSGLSNLAGNGPIPGDHARGTTATLTGYSPTPEAIRGRTSLDQLAAQTLKKFTPRVPSLEIGTDPNPTVDPGWPSIYTSTLSWANETSPLPHESNPVTLFNRLFASADGLSPTEVLKRQKQRKSVLDAVKEDATRLNSALGKSDQRKLDEFMTGVRQLEVRIAAPATACPQAGSPPAAPPDFQTQTRILLDLTVLALQCDLTRVATFMLENGFSQRPFNFIGVPFAHHEISHHAGDPVKLENLTRIEAWEVEQFTYLLRKLEAITEPSGGTLLDNSAVLFTSDMGDPNIHQHDHVPVLLAGGGGGKIRGGRHLRYPGTPVANLYLSMLDMVGVPATGFADSTGRLGGLL